MSRCRVINLTGERFGLYLVVSEADSIIDGGKAARVWNCECSCGEKRAVRQSGLRSGRSNSCGCEWLSIITLKNTTHGMYRSAMYKTWSSMVQRCTNPKNTSYHNYGGRGITVCDKWLKFDGFYNDMGNKPTKNHSIDRIDNDSGYSLENCRWATMIQQRINSRTRKDNKVGLTGVRIRGSSWTAEIGIGGKNKRIGSFSGLFDAAAARISAENKLFKDYL